MFSRRCLPLATSANFSSISLRLFCLLVFFILAASVSHTMTTTAQNAAANQAQVKTQTIPALEIGKPIERELTGGQSHSYQLMLGTKQLLNVVTEQRGVDVTVSLFSPDGKKLLEIDSPNGTQGEEVFATIADAPGMYRIEVRALNERAKPGRYQIRIDGLRDAKEQDYQIPGLAKPFERELGGGQAHNYDLALSEGEYLYLIVEQRGIDVVLTLFGPDKKQIAEVDSPNEAQGPEPLHLIADSTGTYRLEVRSSEKDAIPGRYEIRVAKLWKASERDRVLVEIELLNTEVDKLRMKSNYREAITLTEKVLAIREKLFGPEHALVARSLTNIGDFYQSMGDYDKAEYYLQRGLKMIERLPDFDANERGWAYAGLSSFYSEMGYYAKAIPLMQNALKIWRESSTVYPITAAITLGEMYKIWGDYEKAESYYLDALAVLEKDPSYGKGKVAMFLVDLGGLYATTRQYEKAEQALLRARKLFEVPEALENPDTALADLNLGFLYESKGDYDQAERLYLHSLEVSEKFGFRRLTLLNNLGDTYRAKKDFGKANEFYQRVIARIEERRGPNSSSTDYLIALQGLAELHRAQGELGQAVSVLARALNICEKHLARNIVTGSERQKLLSLDRCSNLSGLALTLHTQSFPNNDESLQLAFTSLLRQKGRVLDTVFDNVAALRRRASAEDQILLKRFVEARTELSNWALKGTSQIGAADYQLRLKQFEDQFEKIEAEVAARSEGFLDQSRLATLEELKTAIPDQVTLIEIARYSPVSVTTGKEEEPRYAAYLLNAGGAPKWVDLGAATAVDKAIDKWRRALQDRRRSDVKSLARAVDEIVMRPIRRHLGATTKVLISPDGSLNLLPFAALVDERGEYLVNRYSFTYLTSGRDLLRLGIKHKSGDETVVVADPRFGERSEVMAAADRDIKAVPGTGPIAGQSSRPSFLLAEAFFPELPGTASEARSLKTLLPDARVLTRAQATETAVKQVSRPRILHIATHGFFLRDANAQTGDKARALRNSGSGDENPYLRSGLALAGANLYKSGDDDGILTALEAAGLDLWGTKLVVLSACNTGVGDVRNGDGVYGLRRALVLAGSESQVMSLWRVSDQGTKELMVAYYTRLLGGEGRGEALRQVQLQMLKQPNRRHPYYWASFIQSGEWANLDGKR